MKNNKKYKIIAILGLDCGLMTFNYLSSLKDVEIISVFCKRENKTDNIAGYIDLSKHINKNLFNYYSSVRQIENKISKVKHLDLVVALGISDILSPSIINTAKKGVLGAHAAKLPQRPGCSPVVWAILDNIKKTEMTLFKMSEKIDNGLIYASKKISINDDETGGSLRSKMDDAIITLLKSNFIKIISGKLAGKYIQGKRNYTRKRGLRDGQIDLSENAASILRKIRALSSPYPGAHIYSGDGKAVVIEKARIGDSKLEYVGSGKNARDKVLCIVAHPDDEALGVGGTLIKHTECGDKVDIIILSEGEDAKAFNKNKDPNRLMHALEWCKKTDCNLYAIFDLPDQKLDNVPQLKIVKLIEEAVINIKPSIVYIHHPGDMNSDHQVASQASLAAMRPMSRHGIKPEIRSFETPSSTDQSPMIEPYIFKPNYYVSVDKQWDRKISALKVYSKEIGKSPHPRAISAIKSLARKRGAEAGFHLAEAFYILRKLWK